MRVTKAFIREASEEAFAAVWWMRSAHSDDPVAQQARRDVEAERPGLIATLDHRDGVLMSRWEGRLATLRWLAAGAEDSWDGPGAFDS